MKKGLIIVCLVLFLFTISYNVLASSKVVVFLADGIDLLELENLNTTYFDKSFKNGAAGLLTTRTAGSLTPENTYLTLGSGTRARTSWAGGLNFNATEYYQRVKAADIYQRRTANQITNGIVSLEAPFLKSYNLASQYQAQIGFLASSLIADELEVTVLGNSDIWQQNRRQAALIGFNQQGFINQGDIGQKMSLEADQYPSGYLTNKDHLLQQFADYLAISDLIIIESGDTSRVEAVKDLTAKQQFKLAKEKAVIRVDNLLGMVYNSLDFEKDYLFLVTPMPSQDSINRGNRLGLLTVVGPGMEGVLYSNTTRRKGLVNNLDFTPAIMSFLSNDQRTSQENPLSSSDIQNDEVSFLIELKELIKKTFSWRPTLIKGFISLQILTLFLACIYLLGDNQVLKKIITYIVLLLLWIPVFFLLSRFFIELKIFEFILIMTFISLSIILILFKFNFNSLVLILPSLVLLVLLSLDLILDFNLIRASIFGYSPVIAARFYGIGNEYMGFLIGGGTSCFFIIIEVLNNKYNLDKKTIIFSYLFFAFVLLLILGHPQLGANFGGLLTMSVLVAITLFKLLNCSLNLSNLLKFLFLALALVFTFLLFNLSTSVGASSHIGSSLISFIENGPSELMLIINRKLAMNLKLFQWTIWTRILLAFIIFLLVILRHPVPKIDKVINNNYYFTKGMYALLLSSVITILINDSGVVAAATLLFYPIFILLYLYIEVNSAPN